MEISFARSHQSTLGVEWEIALVDGTTGDLVPRGRETFEAVYKVRLREAYPEQSYGTVLPFRRIFVVGRRDGS